MKLLQWVTENPATAGALLLLALAAGGGAAAFVVRRVPRRAFGTVLIAIAVFFLCYFPSKLIPTNLAPHDVSIPLDAVIPLWPPMIVVYLLAFVQWAAYWLCLGVQRPGLRCRYVAGELCSKAIAGTVFFVFPTVFARPDATGSGVFERIVALVYLLDAPTNLLPSIHCLQSYLCMRLFLQADGIPKWVAALNVVFTALVFASTLLVRQHMLLDLPTAILAAEAGLLLGRLTKLDGALLRRELR